MSNKTFFFLGVSTAESAVNNVFSRWCERLGVDWQLTGMDLPVGCLDTDYRTLIERLDRVSLAGGLVTSHKVGLYESCWTQMDALEPTSVSLGEIGVIRNTPIGLVGGVSDVESGGHVLNDLLAERNTTAPANPPAAAVIGAGGAGLALLWNICVLGRGDFRSVVLLERSVDRIDAVEDLLARWPMRVQVDIVKSQSPNDCSDVISSLPSGCLIVNASGVGKDTPGSPCDDSVRFPDHSIIWDFNYRGDLGFLVQARNQPEGRLTIEDGFRYFASGWSVVMSRVAGVGWNPELARDFLTIFLESS